MRALDAPVTLVIEGVSLKDYSAMVVAHTAHLVGHQHGDLGHLKDGLEGVIDHILELVRDPPSVLNGRPFGRKGLGSTTLDDLQILHVYQSLSLLGSPLCWRFTLGKLQGLPDVSQVPHTGVVSLEGLPLDDDD